MSEPLSASIERLTRELHQDPYRPDLLIERALLNAACGQLIAASEDVAAIRRLGSARALEPMLSQVVTGAARAALQDGIVFVTGAELSAAAIESSIASLRSIRREADLFFGPPPCLPVIELSSRLAGLHHACHDVPGIGYVKVSPHVAGGDYDQLLAHELAHVYLTSGNRFLDEGIAVFFQSRGNSERLFLGAGTTLTHTTPEVQAPPFPLRALLAYDARHDVFFDRLASDIPAKVCLYRAALIVVACLLDHLKMGGLRALCASLRCTSSTAAHPALIASFLGEEIEALDERLFTRLTPSARGPQAAHEKPIPAAAAIWGQLSGKELNALAARLRKPGLPSIPARAALARVLARLLFDGMSEAPAAALAELRSLVHDVRLDARTPDRERALLEGWLAIAETHAARSVTARVVSWEKALAIFSSALSRHPQDGEVLCATAVLHLRGPVEYGADRALAAQCLSRARQIEGWSGYARSMEKSHDIQQTSRS